MTNHVHLLASAQRPYDLSRMMQHLGRRFVRYVNHVYRRSGTLWEGRFKASLVDTETYFLRCCRYIECNPASHKEAGFSFLRKGWRRSILPPPPPAPASEGRNLK